MPLEIDKNIPLIELCDPLGRKSHRLKIDDIYWTLHDMEIGDSVLFGSHAAANKFRSRAHNWMVHGYWDRQFALRDLGVGEGWRVWRIEDKKRDPRFTLD